MREIKFRAKTLKGNRWVYGFYFKTPLTDEDSGIAVGHGWAFLSDGKIRHCISNENGSVFVIDIKTLGQYIGSKDKNGKKEIYEGDILLGDYSGYKDILGNDLSFILNDKPLTVIYSDLMAGFAPFVLDPFIQAERFEIIGNIYQNPELLK